MVSNRSVNTVAIVNLTVEYTVFHKINVAINLKVEFELEIAYRLDYVVVIPVNPDKRIKQTTYLRSSECFIA